jgi:leader peptidase (prepilin peptidase)/N-methyltransferase
VGLRAALLGLAGGAGAVLALGYGYKAVRGEAGMGGGDVMLMGMVGAFTGPWGALLVLFGGALLGSVFAMVRYRGAPGGKTRLPFGTFLALAGVILCLAGDAPVRWYLARLR